MITKINFDGQDRLAVILPSYASQLNESDFRKLSIFLNLIVSRYAHQMSDKVLFCACGLATALNGLDSNNVNKANLSLPM